MTPITAFDPWMCRWLARKAAATPPIDIGEVEPFPEPPEPTEPQKNYEAFISCLLNNQLDEAIKWVETPWEVPPWRPAYDESGLIAINQYSRRLQSTASDFQTSLVLGSKLRAAGFMMHALVGTAIRLRAFRMISGSAAKFADPELNRALFRGVIDREITQWCQPNLRFDQMLGQAVETGIAPYDARANALQIVFGGREDCINRPQTHAGLDEIRDAARSLNVRELEFRARAVAPWAPAGLCALDGRVSAYFWFALNKSRYQALDNPGGSLYLASTWVGAGEVLSCFNQELKRVGQPLL